MNIIQRLLGTGAKIFNITGKYDWDSYDNVIPNRELLRQYYGWTKRAIKIKVDAIVSNPPTLVQVVSGEEKEQTVETDPLLRDLKHFNPHQTLNEGRMLVNIHKYLTGVGFWLVTKSETPGFTREFYVLNPNNVYYNTVNEWGFPTSYKYREDDGREIIIPAENVIVFKSGNPEDQTTGSSDVQASNYAHNSYAAAMNLNMNYFYNMAKPEAIYTLEGANPEQIAAFEAQFNSKFRGTKKAGKVAFVNREIKALEMTKSLSDMQFIEGIKLMREEILGIHGVPKELAMSSGTYQNVKEAQRIFQLYTLLPELAAETDVLNEQLIPVYYGKSVKGLYFVAANPVEADKESDSKIALNMANINMRMPGTFSKNEVRSYLSEQPIDGGDEYEEELEEITTPQSDTQSRYSEKRFAADIEKEMDRAEAFFRSETTKLLDRQRRLVIADGGNIDVIGESQKFQKKLKKDALKTAERIQQIYLTHRGATQAFIGSIDWIMSYLMDTSLHINNTTAKDIAVIIDRLALEEELDSGKLISEINELFEGYKKPKTGDFSRIDTISRTITGAIQNTTLHNMILTDRTATSRKWRSAKDGDTRPAHAAADGQTVAMNEPFLVDGENLMYPGDPAGSAGNIINCRCIEVPV